MRKGDYLVHLSTIYTQAEMEQLFFILWSIWSERNQVVHGHKAKPAKELALFAKNYMHNFRSSQAKFKSNNDTSARPLSLAATKPVPWTPPMLRNLKLNVDVAVDSVKKVIGVGAVIRDTFGSVKATLSKLVVGNFAAHEI
ncbi:uncharacterized protein LOC133039369 [Cannabis sativa]|uniref:uncharacterized protein LOC133039369 n=1 Tax=Cannabis sativa TaxID=3483 RepID=UPI0029C9F5E7|nr:uncharacterized protein LOC133039369 [Cannabis sativa]